MQVNMLEAKNQLSKLVKAAVAGDEVIIASHGQPQVRLVPCEAPQGLRARGTWSARTVDTDTAFTDEADAAAGRLFGLP